MKFSLLYDNPEESLLARLLKIRNVTDDHDNFLDPSYSSYWQSHNNLHDIKKALDRIQQAIKSHEKIMIFGDYDVDGIVSSYVMVTFFRKFLDYHNISVRLPHRMNDGYGIKSYHIDEIVNEGCSLIITVDNGITATQEAEYAKTLGIDMVITDHHSMVGDMPSCVAVVNPQVGDSMRFKEICGGLVAFKVCCGLASRFKLDRQTKKAMFDHFLPFLAIATVADCMPLIDENRLVVKKGLAIMNDQRDSIAPSLRFLLDELNIKKVDTFHIGFMIAPRLNATGRMDTAMIGLKSFLYSDKEQLTSQFEEMNQLNSLRKTTQDEMVKIAQELIDQDEMLMAALHEEFHEGIVGIVAGRLTEKHNKPSMILGIDHEKGFATGSLRGPSYFSIIDMLKSVEDILERFGGHEQAGGITVKIDKVDELFQRLYAYCNSIIQENDMVKNVIVDTSLQGHELTDQSLDFIGKLGPFGEGNREPVFVIDNVIITHAQQIGKNGASHLKLFGTKDEQGITIMQRRKGDTIHTIKKNTPLRIIGKLKEDSFNGGFYIEGKEIIEME